MKASERPNGIIPNKPVSARRRRRSTGQALLESALTLLPTFALVFALTDCGFMLFRRSTLQNAVREGVRYAITFQQAPSEEGGFLGQDASIKRVVERYSLGMVSAEDTPQHIFVNYYSQDDPYTPLATGGNLPGNIVEVSIQDVSFDWLAPLSGTYGAFWTGDGFEVSVYASDILGGMPVGVLGVPR